MKKIYFWSILILSMMVFLLQPADAQSDVSVWDGFAESWTQGDGTENNPYLIENARHFAYIAEMVNAGMTHYDGTYFKLTTNIFIDSTTAWEPIGLDGTYYFAGHFDGDNHRITIFLHTNTLQYVGLFGYIQNASIRRLGIEGGISSDLLQGYVGGFAGKIFNCIIANCYNSSNISSKCSPTGGVAGQIEYSTVTFSHNFGNITSSYNANYSSCAGGIGGRIVNSSISECYNIGHVSSSAPSSKYSYAGGIVGYSSCSTVKICYNVGNISSYYGDDAYAGGIVGYGNSGSYYETQSAIINCYNVGTISGTNIGGIRGFAGGSVVNCFYLNTCGGLVSGGTPKTEAQMKSSSFPVILNSDSVVYTMDTLNINQGYPIFANEMYVLTEDANNITFNSATLNGVYSGNVDVKGFRYKAESDSVYSTVYCSLSEPYSYSLSGLSAGTTYQYYYFVQKNGASYYGNAKTFSTITCDVSINLTMPTAAVCTGDSVLLIATAESAHTSQFSYQWSTGESGNTILPSSNGLYTVTATADNGCSQTSSYTLSLYPSPAGIISGDTILCEGNNAVLSASGAWSYQWNTGTQGNSITVAAPGVYSCTFTNEYGCTSERSVTVSTLSDIAISGNPHVCEGGSTLLSAPAADSCLWSTGAQNFSILVSSPGTYTVTIYQGQCSASASVVVTSAALPTPTILGNTTICQNQSTTLTANGGTSYAWSSGGTTNSINVTQSGVYTVTATNAEGCTATANITVTVNPLPNVNISGNNNFCQGDNVTLTATGASTYAWSNTSTNAAITVSSAGNYTVTGTDANGCTNTAIKTVSVNPTYNIPLTHSICQGESYNFYGQNLTTAGTYTHTLQTINGCDSVLTLTLALKALPTPAITGSTSLCQGQTTTLTANGGVSYLWSNASTNNSISVSQSGIYTVTATNAEGCSAIANVTVTVNPTPSINISGNTTLCAGNSTTLTASGSDSYSWSTGDNTASVSISAFGVYTVTGTSTAGCSNTANVTVLVSQPPVITITGATDICAGESTTLTAYGGETYLWSDGTTANILTVVIAGTYQVIGYNAAGCNAMASATVTIWQPATTELSIECPDSCYIWNGESYCQSGDYTQTLQTIYGCDSIVTLHLTTTVGINNRDDFDFKVYPNPTNSVVNIQFTNQNLQITEIQILDAYGKLVNVVETGRAPSLLKGANGSATAQINLSPFAPGVYFIKAVTDGNVMGVRKVVKQ